MFPALPKHSLKLSHTQAATGIEEVVVLLENQPRLAADVSLSELGITSPFVPHPQMSGLCGMELGMHSPRGS